jgi:hypothetical protein
MSDSLFSPPAGAAYAAAALRQARSRALALFALLTLLLLAFAAAPAAHAQKASGNFDITGVNLTNFQIVNNVLTAKGTVTGTLAGLPFTADITNFALQLVLDNPATPAVECSVLDLKLGPINLALLGLFVDTSPICLEITATKGGGLLGDLLCSLAGGGVLGTGVPILPTGGELTDLQAGLVAILNGSLGGNLRKPGGGGGGGGDSVCRGNCEILELVLGPLNLSLLGLNVSLDDCAGGPVQVCVSASRGQGILGDLLCGLTGPQLGRLTLADITQLVTKALALSADGSLSRRDIAELTALLGRLIR